MVHRPVLSCQQARLFLSANQLLFKRQLRCWLLEGEGGEMHRERDM